MCFIAFWFHQRRTVNLPLVKQRELINGATLSADKLQRNLSKIGASLRTRRSQLLMGLGLRVQGQEVEEAPAAKTANEALWKARGCCPFPAHPPAASEAKPEENHSRFFLLIYCNTTNKGSPAHEPPNREAASTCRPTEAARRESGSERRPSYLGQSASKERQGMKCRGDFKTGWNRCERNCCFPTIKSDEDPQSICEQ